MRRLLLSLLLALAPLLFASGARADESEAKVAFDEGLKLVQQQRWGDALAAFERASRASQHALTTYNMGIAERALGRLTRARVDFLLALDQDAQHSGQLPESYADSIRGLLKEIEARLVHVTLHVEPKGSALTIDGRPVVLDPAGRARAYYAGLATQATELPDDLEVVVDPGDCEFLLQKEGFSPASVHESYKPGERAELKLSLLALDATIMIQADRPNAVVRVQGLDVGIVPVTLKRPPGTYAIDVRDPGFVTYETEVTVGPGGRSSLNAQLPKQPFALTKQWWFWSSAAALVAGSALTVYFVTRPPAPYDGGNTGWVAQQH